MKQRLTCLIVFQLPVEFQVQVDELCLLDLKSFSWQLSMSVRNHFDLPYSNILFFYHIRLFQPFNVLSTSHQVRKLLFWTNICYFDSSAFFQSLAIIHTTFLLYFLSNGFCQPLFSLFISLFHLSYLFGLIKVIQRIPVPHPFPWIGTFQFCSSTCLASWRSETGRSTKMST